jgi:hypothetical protein
VGLIITHGLLFSASGSAAMIDDWSAPYRRSGLPVWYAEISATLDARLERNATPNRARHKKGDWATPERLREMEGWGSWHDDGTWPNPAHLLSIHNTDVQPQEAAQKIRDRFQL